MRSFRAGATNGIRRAMAGFPSRSRTRGWFVMLMEAKSRLWEL